VKEENEEDSQVQDSWFLQNKKAFTVNWCYKLRKLLKKGKRFSSLGSGSLEDEESMGYRPPPPPPEFELETTPPPPPPQF